MFNKHISQTNIAGTYINILIFTYELEAIKTKQENDNKHGGYDSKHENEQTRIDLALAY